MAEDEVEASIPDELSVEEFLALSEAAPTREKVSDKEILDFLDKGKRTAAIAQHFSVSYSAMLARLKRLLGEKKVLKKYRAKEAFWISSTLVK